MIGSNKKASELKENGRKETDPWPFFDMFPQNSALILRCKITFYHSAPHHHQPNHPKLLNHDARKRWNVNCTATENLQQRSAHCPISRNFGSSWNLVRFVFVGRIMHSSAGSGHIMQIAAGFAYFHSAVGS